MSFIYSLEGIDWSRLQSRQDVLRAVQEHDQDTYLFSINVALLNYAIAIEMKLSPDEQKLAFLTGLHHDVGKLGMSYDFLNYVESYDLDMFEEMKKHAAGGAEILTRVNAEKEVIDTARYHHCNYDGTGYPAGLCGSEIPLYARITRVSDSADAYMSKRCYKEGGPVKEVVDDLQRFNGSSYDPNIVDVFAAVHQKIMKKSHKQGIDHPSQKMYLQLLKEKFNTGEVERSCLMSD